MDRDNGDSSKRERGEAVQEEHAEAKRLKGTFGQDAFNCDTCKQPLKPPIFQCSKGHSILCSSCHDKQPKCQVCPGEESSLERSYVMERAVESILVDCCYAEHGCPEKINYYDKGRHEKICRRAPLSCLYADCRFVGRATELLDHLAGHHKCPCTEFEYWNPFDLRVEKPGVVFVLRSKNDGQHILLHVQKVEQPCADYCVSVVCVPFCYKPAGMSCSMSFSYLGSYSNSTVSFTLGNSAYHVPSFMYFVPKCSGETFGKVDDGLALLINFMCTPDIDDEEDADDSDSTDTESDYEEEEVDDDDDNEDDDEDDSDSIYTISDDE